MAREYSLETTLRQGNDTTSRGIGAPISLSQLPLGVFPSPLEFYILHSLEEWSIAARGRERVMPLLHKAVQVSKILD